MSIHNKVVKMLKSSDRKQKEVLKVVLEVIQAEPSTEVTDAKCVLIIKEIIKETEIFIKNCDSTEQIVHGRYAISLLQSLLIQQVPMDEVIKWIDSNIDMSKYDNPLLSMREIMNKFGNTVDSSDIKTLLNRKYIQQQGLK